MTLRTTMITGAALMPLLAPLALAHDGHHKSHGGFSIGAQAGYITGESRVNRTYLPALPALPGSGFGSSNDVSGRGAIGGLNLAYGYVFSNHLFAGLEIKGEFAGINGSSNAYKPEAQGFDVKMKNSFGASLKFGGVINSVLPYAKVGIVSSKWESTSNDPTGAANFRTAKASKRLTGFEFGVGIDVPVAERVTVGGEFLHTEYGKLSYDHKFAAGIDNVLYRTSIKPRTNAFMMRVKYRFW